MTILDDLDKSNSQPETSQGDTIFDSLGNQVQPLKGNATFADNIGRVLQAPANAIRPLLGKEPLSDEQLDQNTEQYNKGFLKSIPNTIVSNVRGILDPTQKGNMFHDMIVEPIQNKIEYGTFAEPTDALQNEQAQSNTDFKNSLTTPEGIGENVGGLVTNTAMLGGLGKLAEVPKEAEVPIESTPTVNPTPKVNSIMQYVDDKPLDVKFEFNKNGDIDYRKSGTNIRYEHQGDMNANILRGVNAGNEVEKLLPDDNQNMGLTLKRDILNSPDGIKLLQAMAEKYPEYSQAVEYALNPTQEMLEAEKIANGYYGATGQAANKYGYMPHLLDEETYSNRVFPKREGVKQTEVYQSGMPKSTGHAKERVFDTIPQRMLVTGEKPLTLKQSDLMKIHAEENPRVLATHKFYEAIQNSGFGNKVENYKVPTGYVDIGKGNSVSKELYPHIKSIISPKTVGGKFYNAVRKVNGVLKANLLGGIGSGFHFLNITKNMVASNLDVGSFIKYGFDKESRLAYARAGGKLTTQDAGKSVLAELSRDKRPLTQVVSILFNNPLTKSLNKTLFEEYIPAAQTALWKKNMTKWALKHPDATPEQIRIAARSYADHSNNMGGFSNLTAKGMSANTQAIGQQLLLALQWNAAKVNHFTQLFEKTPGGTEARLTALRGTAYSLIFGNILNEIFTGHSMAENPDGHKFDICWGGDVYTNTLPPAYEDAIKISDKVQKNGVIGGTYNFAMGKGSPVVHIGQAVSDVGRNKNYFGQNIYDQDDNPYEKALKSAEYIGSQNMDIPIGFGNWAKLYNQGNTNPYDYILSGTGMGTVGKPQRANY